MRLARDSLTVGERIEILGTVQGVGFRPWVFGVARQMGIAGRVRNDPAGVVIEAFGDSGSLERFRETLREAPSPARIQTLRYRPIPAEATDGFSIAPSTAAAPRRVSIPPDLAICSRCAAEIADPGDRRFTYPFTNCTACGDEASQARWKPPMPLTATIAPSRSARAASAIGPVTISFPFTSTADNRGPQRGQPLGSAWKRRSDGSAYSRAHSPQRWKGAMVVLARS